MKIFNSIGHFFAWLASKFLPAAATDINAFIADLNSPLANAIKQFTPVQVQNYIAASQAIAGDVLNVLVNGGQAIAEGGVNVTLDTATVAAAKQTVNDIKAVLSGQTVPVAQPAPPPASTPIVNPPSGK